MHPFERLRQAARADGEDPARVARFAAGALAGIADDAPGVVTACRRLVEGQPTSGPMWWLAARVLAAGDPAAEAWRSAEELRVDPTGLVLAEVLPEGATVTVLGSPEVIGAGLRRRGDVTVLLVDALAESAQLYYDLEGSGTDVVGVAESGLGGAAANSTLVLLEAGALGPGGLVAIAGSLAAASVAHQAGVPVWAVAGVGRALPSDLWDALVRRLGQGSPPPWALPTDLVALHLVDMMVGPEGLVAPEAAVEGASCPVVPELTPTVTSRAVARGAIAHRAVDRGAVDHRAVMPGSMTIDVVISARNEEVTVAAVVRAALGCAYAREVVVVDDGSIDGTAEVAAAAGARVVRREPSGAGAMAPGSGRSGSKAQAMVVGVAASDADAFLFCDADCIGLTTGHLDAICRPFVEGRAAMSLGWFDYGLWNPIVVRLAPTTGERVVPRWVWDAVPLDKRHGYSIEIMINEVVAEGRLPTTARTLPGVTHRTKRDKLGRSRGARETWRMFWHLVGLPFTGVVRWRTYWFYWRQLTIEL